MKEQWRAELKYTVGTAESRMLAARMAAFMERDIHGGKTGYLVRSLYFDNFYNKALREKLDGVGVREKFRIRCYDGNFGFIRLEKKSKRYNAGNKTQCRVTAEETKRILDGDIGWMVEDERALVRELYLRMQMGIYRPTVIVDYDREALTYAPGNVRVTFDRRIRGCHQPQLFFSENLPSIPAISPDRVVMEVKYDDYLPDIVNRTLLTVKTKEQAFSKYAACRIMC